MAHFKQRAGHFGKTRFDPKRRELEIGAIIVHIVSKAEQFLIDWGHLVETLDVYGYVGGCRKTTPG